MPSLIPATDSPNTTTVISVRSAILVVTLGIALSLVAGTTAKGQQPSDTSGAIGIWYLNANDYRLTATITQTSPNSYQGNMTEEGGGTSVIDNITWLAGTRTLQFRRVIAGAWQWYRGTVVEGILVGRYSRSTTSGSQPADNCTCYASHVTGWNSSYIDQGITPRVYDVVISNHYRARLRIDSSSGTASGYTGRLKIYATIAAGANYEELEYDLEVTQWNGSTLSFTRHLGSSISQTYTGTVSGRYISGTFTSPGDPAPSPWNGQRAEVLSYGLASKTSEGRTNWQARARRQLLHLMMAANPPPLSVNLTPPTKVPLSSSAPLPANRDDDPSSHPRNYQLSELTFHYTLPNPYGGSPIARETHGYLAVPSPSPGTGVKLPAVIAVNGHGSSARQMMDATTPYWYGDAFARRGFVVLALDIGHRPVQDRGSPPLYPDSDCDQNGLPRFGLASCKHDAVKAAGFDSDWEEDGERAWDAMRAADYLSSLPYVDTTRLVITGHSMGGEVASIAGALDQRFSFVIPSGYSPDLSHFYYEVTHNCWRWINADIREYVGMLDYHALTAPRPLLIETGKEDDVPSRVPEFFTASKQIARRIRVAYGNEVSNFIHYLHYDAHSYHVGDVNPSPPAGSEQFIRVPITNAPESPYSSAWQAERSTTNTGWTLFDFLSLTSPPTPTPPTPATSIVQFSSTFYTATEDCSQVNVQVVRSGSTTGRVTVDLISNDGTAKQKGDYTNAISRLTFEAGVTQKTVPVLMCEDSYTKGPESFTLTLSNPTGRATLGGAATTTVQIADDASEGSANPIDDPRIFACTHYHDFLARPSDQAGEDFWTNETASCGADAACIDAKRVNVSAAFFLSIEFQGTGYFVIRAQKSAFGSAKSNPRYAVFLGDQRQIGDGVVIGTPGSGELLEQNKQKYLDQFVSRADFVAQFPQGATAAAYVDKLFQNAGVTPPAAERDAAIAAYGSGDQAGRIGAFRSVIESNSVFQKLYNPAFVLAQYYGYLRRNPDDMADNNFDGYDFWLNKLEQFSLPNEDVRDEVVAFRRVQRAEMVRSFIISIEYRERFGGRPSGNQQSKQDASPIAASKGQEFGSVLRHVALQFLRVATSSG